MNFKLLFLFCSIKAAEDVFPMIKMAYGHEATPGANQGLILYKTIHYNLYCIDYTV